MKENKMMALIEIAKEIQSQPGAEGITFLELYDKVCEIKEFDEEEKRAHIAQFYTDITASGDFIYCGDDKWNLKKNLKTDDYDKELYNEHNEVEGQDFDDEPRKIKRTVRRVSKDALDLEEEANADEIDNEDEGYENIGNYSTYEYDEDAEPDYNSHEDDFDSQLDIDEENDDDYDADEEKYNDIMDE